jgi:hypothetical protein
MPDQFSAKAASFCNTNTAFDSDEDSTSYAGVVVIVLTRPSVWRILALCCRILRQPVANPSAGAD